MSRIDPTPREEQSLENACDCGANRGQWCVTASGGFAVSLHVGRLFEGEYCSTVESNDCEAPAGYQVGGLGGGIYEEAGVAPGTLLRCGYCDEPVCRPCSTLMIPPDFLPQEPTPVCLIHNENELAEWLGLPEMQGAN